jgi:hypothetical protein
MDQVVPFLFLYHRVLFPEPYSLLPAEITKSLQRNIIRKGRYLTTGKLLSNNPHD